MTKSFRTFATVGNERLQCGLSNSAVSGDIDQLLLSYVEVTSTNANLFECDSSYRHAAVDHY